MDKTNLVLRDPKYSGKGDILSGILVSESGNNYPIVAGIPRFVSDDVEKKAVDSFGKEWNYFNFDFSRLNWLAYTVKNTFGSTDVFKNKVVVDAGAGSGMQSVWMAEAGADYVISLELSQAVDGIIKKNTAGIKNIDVVQCSVDAPPIKDDSISGIVMCHNVIQHTPSVEATAAALWRIVAPGGEFVFNCYGPNDEGLVRKLRFKLHLAARAVFSRLPFGVLLFYSKFMSLLRFVPGLGYILEKSRLMLRGGVPEGPDYFKRAYKCGVLNTYDYYGSHKYQHHKTEEEQKNLAKSLQPDMGKIKNWDVYFSRPSPICCALRLSK
jgi:SAM-dependent methyltransferase